MTNPALPARLREIVDEFRDADRSEKLELLLEFSDKLPALPERLRTQRDQMEQVHECMSPVFLFTERDGAGLVFHFDVPAEAPTTRGFASLMAEGLHGSTPAEVLSLNSDFFSEMGMPQLLSPQRLNGITAIVAYMKRQAMKFVE